MNLVNIYKYWLGFILLLGAVFRIYGMWDMPLNLDERWHIYPAAVSTSLLDAILYHAKFDGHPPLTPIWTYLMLQISDNNFWLRLPSLISGILLIYVGFILGRKVGENVCHDETKTESGIICGLLLASLIAFSYITVIQSQVVRGYSVMMLCNALAYYAALQFDSMKSYNKWLYYYILSNICGIMSIHSSIVFSAAIGFVFFINYLFFKKDYKKTVFWGVANSIIVICFAASYALTTIYGGARGVMGPNGLLKTEYNSLIDVISVFSINFNVISSSFMFKFNYSEFVYYTILAIIISLTIILIIFFRKFHLYTLVILVCAILSTIIYFKFHSAFVPERRMSYLLVANFIGIVLVVNQFASHLKFRKLYAVFLLNVIIITTCTYYMLHKNISDEYYKFSESNQNDFELVQRNDILIVDAMSVLELLYPEKRNIERFSSLVLKISNLKFPIYSYAFDFREIQGFISVYDYQQFLKSLFENKGLNNKDIVWIWRKMEPWGYDVQTQLYCGYPDYINRLPNETIKSKSLIEWNALSEKIKIEAAKHTPKHFQDRALMSDCQHVMYGLSVEFIKTEILDKEFIDINTLIEKDIIENGKNNDPRKIRRMQMIFENYRKGGSVL